MMYSGDEDYGDDVTSPTNRPYWYVQPLGLTPRDMLDQAAIDAMNTNVRNLLTLGFHSGASAIRAIGAELQMQWMDETDPTDTSGGYVQLWRDDAGRYVTVWFVSEYGDANDVATPAEWDAARVGFDTQPLGWANSTRDE